MSRHRLSVSRPHTHTHRRTTLRQYTAMLPHNAHTQTDTTETEHRQPGRVPERRTHADADRQRGRPGETDRDT